jgi:hypothetical protein
MLTGNKGEWSEIYVFLKLLAEGRLNAADANLEVIEEIYYPIIKILRKEVTGSREYRLNGSIKVVDGSNGTIIVDQPISDFISISRYLFQCLRSVKGPSFSFDDIESFLNSIDVKSLTALKTDKSDIKIVVHDLITGLKPVLGFSIKSMIGSSSTLFNPGKTTNFIYEIVGGNAIDTELINQITEKPKILNRINKLCEIGYHLEFRGIESDTLNLNLQLIDTNLPKILSELLLIKYTTNGVSKLKPILEQLTTNNPLDFDLSQGHPFYDYKIKNFLTDSALGMTPASIWTGKYDATGGIIIVREDGEIVCYHIYNRNEFQDYLLNNTILDQASTSRYSFGEVYQNEGKYFMKLNLQIRFS